MSKVDLRDIVKGTPEAEAAMHRAMEQAKADMEAVHQRQRTCYRQSIDKTADKITTILVDLWNMVDIEDVEEQLIDVGAIADAREATQALINQAQKDLLEAIMEEMPDDEEIVEQRPGEVETFLHNQHAIGFNDCLTQALAVIKEIEDEL